MERLSHASENPFSGTHFPLKSQKSQIFYEEWPRLPSHFSIEKVIARGGFGTVYLAYHVTLQRRVAIKVAHSREFKSATAAERFLREARLLAQG